MSLESYVIENAIAAFHYTINASLDRKFFKER